VTACSHLGRPKGKPDPKYSLDPVRAKLAELAPGVELLENLRFDPGEEGNDPAFADRLCEGQDLYVNDAFGSSHRAHASIVGPPARQPSAAGRLLAREVEVLGKLVHDPDKPFVAVLGGAMAFTFLLAQGHEVSDSLVEPDWVDRCRSLLDEAEGRILLPSDFTALGPGDEVRQVGRSMPSGWKGLDIGPGSAAEFSDAVAEARTLFWNGPMGVFEDPRFEAGTRTVAEAVADCRGFTVVGGGDSASALKQFGLDDRVDHVSTGGGASLEYIEQGDLPGLQALRKAVNARP
jgi:phosphoglycerate kinase